MPQRTANHSAMHCQVDDLTQVDDCTDPWSASETIWIQHGFGHTLHFRYPFLHALD